MAVEQVAEQALPFVVEPIASARIKLWSRFAGQMASEADIDIASNVYLGFWYDNHVFKMYDYLLPWVDGAATGDARSASNVVMWLTSLAEGLVPDIDMWSRVTRGLLGQVGDVSFPRQYKDADQHVASSVVLLAEVRSFGIAVCQEFGFAVPQCFFDPSTSPTVPAAGEDGERL